ncbi:hypothetical protein AYI69_g709 [Smittium culicis]|uniref:Uncharacterized protein n=1 Tax=Smittium culicis TaxID=133412 RepID=A0A1R1YS93_9FUNG|nr:hypothetical protein AYI69_g709 [Smittium culicis]
MLKLENGPEVTNTSDIENEEDDYYRDENYGDELYASSNSHNQESAKSLGFKYPKSGISEDKLPIHFEVSSSGVTQRLTYVQEDQSLMTDMFGSSSGEIEKVGGINFINKYNYVSSQKKSSIENDIYASSVPVRIPTSEFRNLQVSDIDHSGRSNFFDRVSKITDAGSGYSDHQPHAINSDRNSRKETLSSYYNRNREEDDFEGFENEYYGDKENYGITSTSQSSLSSPVAYLQPSNRNNYGDVSSSSDDDDGVMKRPSTFIPPHILSQQLRSRDPESIYGSKPPNYSSSYKPKRF